MALAHLARHHGPLEQARSLCHQALSLQSLIGDLPGIVVSLEQLASLAGNNPDAARLLGAAQALRGGRGYARAPAAAANYERGLGVVRDELGGDAFGAAWAEGLSRTAGEASPTPRGDGGLAAARRRGGQASLRPSTMSPASPARA